MSLRRLIVVATLLVAARAHAGRICVKSDTARERLNAEQQSVVRQVFEAVLFTAGQEVGDPCGETWSLSHVRLGESLHVLLVTPRGAFTATSPAFELLGMTYEGLVWRVLASAKAPPAVATIDPNETLPVDVAAPAAPAGPPPRGNAYARVGYGLAPAMTGENEARTGPTVGVGYRRATGDWLLDISVMNTHAWQDEREYDYNFLSFGRLAVGRFILADKTSTWYAGGALSFGESAVRVVNETSMSEETFKTQSMQLEGFIGFEMFRDRPMRVFFEAWLTAPSSSVKSERWDQIAMAYEATEYWAPTLNLSTGIGF